MSNQHSAGMEASANRTEKEGVTEGGLGRTPKSRRPKLTRKRIKGLALIADAAESKQCQWTADEQALVRTALSWIRQMEDRR